MRSNHQSSKSCRSSNLHFYVLFIQLCCSTFSYRNRHEEFLSIFRELRRRFDDDDGAIDEDTFRTMVTQKAKEPFTPHEIDTHLDALCEQGKVMKSDGVLYIID